MEFLCSHRIILVVLLQGTVISVYFSEDWSNRLNLVKFVQFEITFTHYMTAHLHMVEPQALRCAGKAPGIDRNSFLQPLSD